MSQAHETQSHARIGELARDLLVRTVRSRFEGWPMKTDPRGRTVLGNCLLGWAAGISARMPEVRRASIDTALALLEVPVPPGWMPESAHDELLVAVFDRHWHVR